MTMIPVPLRWWALGAALWFWSWGVWLLLSAADMLSRPWDILAHAALALGGLALAGTLMFDTWRDARAARQAMEVSLAMMEAKLAALNRRALEERGAARSPDDEQAPDE